MGGSIFRRPAASFWRRRRGDGGVRARVLGDEVGVGSKAVAGALDLDDDGVMQKPVEHDQQVGLVGADAGHSYVQLGEAGDPAKDAVEALAQSGSGVGSAL